MIKFKQSAIAIFKWVKQLFGFSKSAKTEDDLPSYPDTFGRIVALPDEQLEAMAEMELDEADRRIVSAFYDYIGKCYMLFTRGGRCLSVPHSLLPYADLAIPEELDILDQGRGIQFGNHYKTTTAYILWLLEDEAELKREMARGN
jgi:hypothetical protein